MRSRRLLAAAALLTAIPAAGCVAYPDSYGYYDDGYYSSSYDDDYYDGYWGYYARDGYYRRGSYYYNNAYPGYTFGNGGYWYGGSWYSRPIVIVNHNDRHNGRHDRWRHDGNRHDRRCGNRRTEVGVAFADAAIVGEQRPGNDQAEDNQATQQLGRAEGHLLRWLAMCPARARSEENIRRLSWLSERNWKP